MPVAEQTLEHVQPLTVLSEDEAIFRDSVRQFADAQVRPLVREMDEQAKIPRSLVDKLFELGVMGIEIPESLWRRRRDASSTRCSPSRSCRASIPSIGVLVDVQNTLVVNAFLRWGNDDLKRRYLPKLAAARSAPMRCRRRARAATRSR